MARCYYHVTQICNKRELEGAKSILSSIIKCHDSKIKTQFKKKKAGKKNEI